VGVADTFEGLEEDRSSLIVAKWGGTTIAAFTTNLTFLPGTNDDFAEVTIRLHQEGLVDVSYRCTPIFTRLPLPDYTPLSNSRFGLGARTGGFYETHTIDDLAIEVDAVGAMVDASAPGDPITGLEFGQFTNPRCGTRRPRSIAARCDPLSFLISGSTEWCAAGPFSFALERTHG
jgi:hypothetical protein